MKKSVLAMAALGTLTLSACGPVQIVELLGSNHYKIASYQPHGSMFKPEADYILSLLSEKECPYGWKILKEYQTQGPRYPIFNWEIECFLRDKPQ